MNYQLGVAPNPLSSTPRSQTPTSSQTSTISLSSTPSPYTRTQNALTQELFGMQGSSPSPMDQHPQYLMSPPPPPPPQGRGHGSPSYHQQVVLINHVDQSQQQEEVVAGKGKRATPKGKGAGGRKTPHATPVKAQAGEPLDSDDVQVVADMGVPAGGRRGSRPPPMDKEAKKERTRENEKERRQKQKNGMRRLRELIPAQPEEENGKKKTINDGEVVNQAATYIEDLLKQNVELKQQLAASEGKLNEANNKFEKAEENGRQIYFRKCRTIQALHYMAGYGVRLARKLELATAKLKNYHEFAVKNPDKMQPQDVDIELFEVEAERVPKMVESSLEKVVQTYGDDTAITHELAYLKEKDKVKVLEIERPPGQDGGRSGGGNRQQGRGQVVGHGGQVQFAVNKQQAQVALSKQQAQLLMSAQSSQQAARRQAQAATRHQVAKIMPTGLRLPNIGNTPAHTPGQQGQVRLIAVKHEPSGETQLVRYPAPNRNDHQLQITGGNLILTRGQDGGHMIMKANDGTQLYSLANNMQQQQGRLLLNMIKQGQRMQVRAPGMQGPRGPVMQPPQQVQIKVVKRDLFQGGVQFVQCQQQRAGGQGVRQQQGVGGQVARQQQGVGVQTVQQQRSHRGQGTQQQKQQGPVGQAIQQQQQGPLGQAIKQQQQQGPGGQAIQQQQQGPAVQAVQQQPQIPGGQAMQVQGPGIQTIHLEPGPVVEATQPQAVELPSIPGSPMTQSQVPEVGNFGLRAIKQEAVEDEDVTSQQQTGGQVNQTQQQGPEAEFGLRAIKQEPFEDDDGAMSVQQIGGQVSQIALQGRRADQFGLEGIKQESEEGDRESRPMDAVSSDFDHYTFEDLVAGLDSQTGPFSEGVGSDNTFNLGLLGMEPRDDGSQASTSRGSFGGGTSSEGFDLGKIKSEPIDEDDKMDEGDEDEDETGDEESGGEEGAAGGSPRIPGWKIDGIGDEVVYEQPERMDFTRCGVPIENMPGCVRKIGGGVKPGESTSGPKGGVVVRGEVFSEAQVPAEGSLEYQVQMLTVEEWKGHDELFRKHPLFKHDFLWGEQKDKKKCKEIQGIIDRCWAEVVEERKVKDRAEVEEIKRIKIEEKDEDYEDKGKGRGKRQGGRGRKRR